MAPDRTSRVAALATRVLEAVEGLTRRRSARADRIALLVALVAFVFTTVIAVLNLPDVDQPVRWAPLAATWVLLVPATVLVNAAEYRVTASLLRQPSDWRQSARVSVLATAFNLLPVPGAVVVRMNELKRGGSTYRSALAGTAVVGLGFVSMSMIGAGALATPGHVLVGGLIMVSGVAGLSLVHVLVRNRLDHTAARVTAQIALIEATLFLLTALRIFVVAVGLGYEASAEQAGAVAMAGVIALAVGVFPGGLGIREALAAALSPLVGLDPAVGVIVTAVDRVIGLTSVGTCAGLLLWLENRRSAPA